MVTRYREPLPRLNIPPSLNLQQPVAFDGRHPLFSPALPTSLQHSLHPPFPMNNNSIQTPMQPFFAPHPPAPFGQGASRVPPNLDQLSAVGVHPPIGIPLNPLRKGHFHHPSLSLAGIPSLGPQSHPPRNRRQPSIGGPPKAALGGPGRKHSPLPPSTNTPPPVTSHKLKKVNVILPKELLAGEGDNPATRPSWARIPLDPSLVPKEQFVKVPELTSADSFPPDSWRYLEPTTIEVFLPGKNAWDAIKKQVIEEKLEKLGVERGSGSSIPHIHAPHARAASISTPADPFLLYSKLNRLQQAQTISSLSSVSTSPQPPFALPASPHQPPRYHNRHGQSMSLAQTPFTGPLASIPSALSIAPNPDQALNRFSPNRSPVPATPSYSANIYAPQGRAPLTVTSLAPPLSAVRPENRHDFARGFGLDIPEEDEPPELSVPNQITQADEGNHHAVASIASIENDAQGIDVDEMQDEEDLATALQSRLHSRQVSHASAVPFGDGLTEEVEEGDMVPLQNAIPVPKIDDLDQDAAEEWTGSEDLYMGVPGTPGEESIGEWSNPSDEERARSQRAERRMLRRARETELPRKLPNFPRPPNNAMVRPLQNEDDIISNPSEENLIALEQLGRVHQKVLSNSMESSRMIPDISHSRAVSGQLSLHDLTQVHSRTTSNQHVLTHNQEPSLSGRRNSLNPFAKPFVFGGLSESDYRTSGTAQATSTFGHFRLPSLGKPLNAAAQEFKPSTFTFRPPPDVPRLTFPAETARPLPLPPAGQFAGIGQGREKRQRRGSSASYQGEDSMESFRFPNPARRSEPSSPSTDRRPTSLQSSAQPQAFDSFPGRLPFVPQESFPLSLMANDGSLDETLQEHSTVRAENGNLVSPIESSAPPSAAVKPKRTPLPLNFKHPTSSNTIPAGVFKALANGDDRTRRSVRSRLDSRDIFEHMPRQSLDDSIVPPISQQISRMRLVTDPGSREPQELDDIFGSGVKRRSSLPSALHSPANSSDSHSSDMALDLTGNFELQRHRLQKQDQFLSEQIEAAQVARGQSMSPSTKAMITEVVSLFRAQLQESASRGLDESQMDARGELDFELIKDVIQQGQAESRDVLHRALSQFAEQVTEPRSLNGLSQDTKFFLEQLHAGTVDKLAATISQLSDRFESMGHARQTWKSEGLIGELMSVLKPVIASVRSDSVDYEHLTNLLSQAVKPHISQLIDLASDKRETAGLIVERLIPLIQASQPAPGFDSDDICHKLASEIRKVIAPIDPFEIKEHVADLVVERLDSRLTLRNRTFNVDAVSQKIDEGVAHLLQPIQSVASNLDILIESQEHLSTRHDDLKSLLKDALSLLSDLPSRPTLTVEAFSRLASPEADVNTVHMKSTVENLVRGQTSLSLHHEELLSLHKDILDQLHALPDSFSAATSVLQVAHADFASSHENAKRDLEEQRKLNADYQTQLAKARTAHGQARVEKDLINEKLTEVAKDRDLLLAEVKEAQADAATKAAELLSLQTRTSELEEALSQALARLQASDVAAQTSEERIANLERMNNELISENQSLKLKIESFESQVAAASRCQQAAEQSLTVLQKQHDDLAAQQSHWVDLRQVSDQVKTLTALLAQADNDEPNMLKHMRDRCHLLEGDYVALQKRFKEQEANAANSEKAAFVARQSLSQAQQRASEWERRAKEYEGKLEMTQTRLDQAEQTQAQLEADYSLSMLQLEEREADSRLAKDRENRLQEQIKSLEVKLSRLRNAPEPPKSLVASNWPKYLSPVIGNGNSRPDSRLSAALDNRSGTPILHTNGRRLATVSPPPSSVWDSMHAPSDRTSSHDSGYLVQVPTTPKAHRPLEFSRPAISSPTPSNVSLAPTQGEDGWWS